MAASRVAAGAGVGVGWLARDIDSPTEALILSLPLDDGTEQRLRLTVSERDTDDVKIEVGDSNTIRASDGERQYFHALIGVFNLLAGPYVCVATEVKVVGASPVDGSPFVRIDKAIIVPVSLTNASRLNSVMKRDETKYLGMLNSVIRAKTLHYSSGSYHITHTQQRSADIKASVSWKVADPRFFWNSHLINDFKTLGLDRWCTVIMNGFIEVHDNCDIDGNEFRYILISRRSINNQGTRFVSRGVDAAGNVSNYAETEQLAIFPDGRVSSYVQIRGSIPLFWQQLATLKYTPKVEFTAEEHDHAAAFNHHFNQQVALYGTVVCVNLIDKKGDQLSLGSAYQQLADKTDPSTLRYVWFDFHHECRKMKWENLSKLVDIIKDDFSRIGFFSTDRRGNVLTRQHGVIRTNCIDNLDRTNVVQSLFARRSILHQLERSSDNVLDSPYRAFEKTFKNAWANHADTISLLYSGTGALKTDFTRTGKRTKMGALQDGVNSVTRYYLNNFADGHTQDSIDLFLGKFEPGAAYVKGQEDRYRSPWSKDRVCGASSPLFIIKLLFIIITLLLVLCTKFSLKKWSGRQFVQQPRLVDHTRTPIPYVIASLAK